MRTASAGLAVACALVWTGPVSAQVEVLTPDMVARLEPAKEKPLTLAPNGDVARFLAEAGQWEEAAPPLILDLNRDGVKDFVVLSLVDASTIRRAIIIHDWGDASGVFGEAVFYLIFDAGDNLVEWGGKHRLIPRPRPAARE